LFSKIDSNKLRDIAKNETTLICAKFGANLVDTFKVTSRGIKWLRFLLPSCIYGSLHSASVTWQCRTMCYCYFTRASRRLYGTTHSHTSVVPVYTLTM